MILLSALLASLTGLVSGERPVARAQVESSAVATVAQAGAVALAVSPRPAQGLPHPVALAALPAPARAARPAVLPAPFTLLPVKQSWLE